MYRLLLLLWVFQGFAAFNLTWAVPAVSLDSNPPIGDTDLNARIAIDPLGNAIAVWGRTSGSNAAEDIWASTYSAAARTWTGAIKISGGANASNPQVAVDKEGNALFLWDEGFPTQIKSRTLSKNGVWSDITNIAGSFFPQTNPQLKLDENGNALAIWMELYASLEHICSATKQAGGQWTKLGEISSSSGDAKLNTTKSLAINKTGTALAAWEETNGASTEIHAARFDEGAWGIPLMIATHYGKVAHSPAVAIDPTGLGTVVWIEAHTVRSRRVEKEGLGLTYVASNPNYSALHPDVAVDDQGNAVLVFERYDALYKYISAAQMGRSSVRWTRPIDISAPTDVNKQNAGFPVLALNAIGNGVAIWKEFDGKNMIIQGSGYSLGTWSFIKTLSGKEAEAGALFPAYDIDVDINLAGHILAVFPEDPMRVASQQIKAAAGIGLANIAPEPPIALASPHAFDNGVASGHQEAHRYPAHLDLVNILRWSPADKVENFASYRIYRGNLSNLIGTSITPYFEDHQRVPKQKELYLITAIDRYDQESSPLSVIVHPK